jgi:hypothetical protein
MEGFSTWLWSLAGSCECSDEPSGSDTTELFLHVVAQLAGDFPWGVPNAVTSVHRNTCRCSYKIYIIIILGKIGLYQQIFSKTPTKKFGEASLKYPRRYHYTWSGPCHQMWLSLTLWTVESIPKPTIFGCSPQFSLKHLTVPSMCVSVCCIFLGIR